MTWAISLRQQPAMQAPETLFPERSHPSQTCCGLTLGTPSIEVRPWPHACHPVWVPYAARPLGVSRGDSADLSLLPQYPQSQRILVFPLECKIQHAYRKVQNIHVYDFTVTHIITQQTLCNHLPGQELELEPRSPLHVPPQSHISYFPTGSQLF